MLSLDTLEQETGIEQSILQAMRDIDNKINQNQTLEADQVEAIQQLMENMIGDMAMNKTLATLNTMSARDTGIGSVVVSALNDISYRTRNLDKIAPELDQIWTNFQAAKNENRELEEDEKISLKHYGILYDLATLNKTMQAYEQVGLIAGNENLERLYAQTQKAADIVSHLDNTFNQTFTMPSGAVIFDDTYKKSEIQSKELSKFEKFIASAITKYGHASKGISVESSEGTTENKVSHINPGYLQDKFALRNFLYSDVYQIKIENLINPEQQQCLEEHFGENWLEHVQEKFAQIERDMHDQKKTKHFHVAAEGGKMRFAEIGTSMLQGGHQNWLFRDHIDSDVRDRVMSKEGWAAHNRENAMNVLCSEFVGMTIIATFQELNDQLKRELQEKEVEDIPDRLVENPISEYEKMYLLTPERLLNALEESGAVVKVESPEEISKFVAVESNVYTAYRQELAEMRQRSEEEHLEDENSVRQAKGQ